MEVLGKRLFLDNDAYRSSVFCRLSFGIREKPSPRILKPGSPRVSWRPVSDQAQPRLIPIAIGRLHAGTTLRRHRKSLMRWPPPTARVCVRYPAQALGPLESSPCGALVGNVRPMLMVLMAAVVSFFSSVREIANLLLARASARP